MDLIVFIEVVIICVIVTVITACLGWEREEEETVIKQ